MSTYLTQQQFNILREYEKKLPRFLFRGFHPGSGGGDPRLNTKEGVTPHAFLENKRPTWIGEIPNLRHMIDGHLKGGIVLSPFSSWAADFGTAVGYTEPEKQEQQGQEQQGSIAILDTSIVEFHVGIYHVPGLHEAGLAFEDYYHEYLVYGPIKGRAYYCVNVDAITSPLELLLTEHLALLTPRRQMSQQIYAAAMATIYFNQGNDIPLDMLISLMAYFVAYQSGGEASIDLFASAMVATYWGHVDQVAQSLGDKLVNENTCVRFFPELEWTVNALVAIKARLASVQPITG